jgi:molybdopterin-guanine dinucleotide biosynthesis protein A
MGRDKALLEVDGIPMWRRQRELLASAGAAEIFLSARPEQPWVREAMATGGFAAVLHDAMPSAGPLCGITAALERATQAHVMVLAIDLPQMTTGWLTGLIAMGAPGVGAVGRHEEFFEPLAAVYPREITPLAWQTLSAAQYALQPLIADGVKQGLLRAREIRGEEVGWFENRNQ